MEIRCINCRLYSGISPAGITAPVLLFFADDDEMIQAEGYEPFVAKLRETNSAVTLKTVPKGGHYQSMISQGIPAGIESIGKVEGGVP